MNEKIITTKNENKISVSDYIKNHELLTVKYIPFDQKIQIVGYVIRELVDAIGGINSSMLRSISTEVFIESVTNIDMNMQDENGLKGFDQLLYHHELDNLLDTIGSEYEELKHILDERIQDYIRTETNPALTINLIYDQVKAYLNAFMESLSQFIQNLDASQISKMLISASKEVGVTNES